MNRGRENEPTAEAFSDAQVALMPLHSITEVLGHQGLTRRFEIEKTRFTPDEQALLDKAYRLSMDLHAEDERYREPATNHMLRVAIRIMHHYQVYDANLIAAALLHDSVEDHPDFITGNIQATSEEALERISTETNPDVAALVGFVTNPAFDRDNRLGQYQEHVRDLLLNGDPRAVLLKVSDFTDNALGVKYMPTDGSTYRARRYLPLVEVYKEAINRPDLPISQKVREEILRQIDEAQELLSGLLAA